MNKAVLVIMFAAGFLLLLSVLASKTSSRYGIPVLLIFIILGMLAGSEGPGRIDFNNPTAMHILGTIALVFILFSGGFSTHFSSVKPIWREGVCLAFLGVLISTGIMSVLIHYALGWSWTSAALLSSTFSSTDASAVFGILKTQKLQLRPKIQALLELESGSNDPMAVFLTLCFIQVVLYPGTLPISEMFMNFFIQMSLGAFTGWFLGKGLVWLINWLNLELVGLYPVLTVAGVTCIYSLTEFCGGNGFLSVYLAGLSMSAEECLTKKTLVVFHDGLAWLMQTVMFLALGLLSFPSEIKPVIIQGLGLSVGLLLIARPLSTYACLFKSHFTFNEKLFISWGGLRGAVPIILATYLLASHVPGSKTMFNLIFFIVIFSMIIQGTTLKFMSRHMNVQERKL